MQEISQTQVPRSSGASCECFAFPGVTPAHKGLKPSGLSFIQRTFINLPFKAHTKCISHWAVSGKPKVDEYE